jgi:hypothetical protein
MCAVSFVSKQVLLSGSCKQDNESTLQVFQKNVYDVLCR